MNKKIWKDTTNGILAQKELSQEERTELKSLFAKLEHLLDYADRQLTNNEHTENENTLKDFRGSIADAAVALAILSVRNNLALVVDPATRTVKYAAVTPVDIQKFINGLL